MINKVMTNEERILSVQAVDGSVFNVGDEVTHEGAEAGDEIATITGFYFDSRLNEIRANTTKGNAGLDYLEIR